MKDYISPIKEQLDAAMHTVCTLFCTIGTPLESPRWFNYRGFDHDDKVLTIGSTQRHALKFKVQTEFNHVEIEDFWPQFRVYRTEFLKKNYPTIETF